MGVPEEEVSLSSFSLRSNEVVSLHAQAQSLPVGFAIED